MPSDVTRSIDPALELQGSLFGAGEPTIDPLAGFERLQLDAQSWVDVSRTWLIGGDELLARLRSLLSWHHQRRPMYDRIVEVPRLTAAMTLDHPALPPALADGARRLGRRYDRVFDRLGFNLYRNGRDSVAWHGDRVGRWVDRPVVAVLTLGAARPFRLRPVGGGKAIGLTPACGDVVVMGGRCQTRWQHAVPKVAQSGPRLSVTFRYGPDDRPSVRSRHVP